MTKGQSRTAEAPPLCSLPRTHLLSIIHTLSCQELPLIILGAILLIIGFVAGIQILWTIGIVVLVAGAILAVAGMVGHGIGGRRHYY
jgi:hypothetical protein